MVTCRTTDSAAVFDTATWQEIALIKTPGKTDTDFPFHFAERAPILAVESVKSVLLWDTATHRIIKEIYSNHESGIIGFAISADATMLAMGYTDDSVTLHDCGTGERIATIPSHVCGVEWIAFSPDGRTLATAGGRWVRLWNVATRRAMFSAELSTQVIWVEFTPDGNGLLTADIGGKAHLLRAPPLEEVPQTAKSQK